MTEETRKALLMEPGSTDRQDINTAHTGLGVYAVHQRLKYLFGEGYGLTIRSSPGRDLYHDTDPLSDGPGGSLCTCRKFSGEET
ncbi:MAG: sensor histidine kinase [Blautia marasmi]